MLWRGKTLIPPESLLALILTPKGRKVIPPVQVSNCSSERLQKPHPYGQQRKISYITGGDGGKGGGRQIKKL